jgi:FkbM family methyltransferase
MVDCGAFDGDTIQQVIDRVGSHFKSIHAIEADPVSLNKLEKNMDRMSPEVRQKVKVHGCAVGAKRGKVRFDDSKISEHGGVEVDCISINELFVSTPVTMIKMDIEGAEYDALIGGTKIIQRDRPILAVCVYHLQNDLWRLPLLAQEMLPQHKFYLRTYEGDGFQTVLYAVPPDRLLSGAENASFHA